MPELSRHSALNPGNLPRSFSIGLSALDPEQWILPDVNFVDQVRAKAELLATRREAVFRAEDATLDAQSEALHLLLAYLERTYPDLYSVSGDKVEIVPAGLAYNISDYSHAPLELACLLVQDDLVIMRKGNAGYRIAAAAVCFPSTWVLEEKFSRPISEVHAPVPGFGPGTRTAGMIDRIFDNLRVGHPVCRSNWSLYEVPDLHHPFSHSTHTRWTGIGTGFIDGTWLRAERQTLMRLPESDDVLFTIQIAVDPVSLLMTHPRRHEIAQQLKSQIEVLDEQQLAYKGIREHREVILAELSSLAGQGES